MTTSIPLQALLFYHFLTVLASVLKSNFALLDNDLSILYNYTVVYGVLRPKHLRKTVKTIIIITCTEAYRSGHNEAVLKTVWVQAHGGSNPSASATKT